MKKIFERAKVQRDRYVNFPRIKDSELLLIESSYVTGATEQREIDIQRACEFLQNEVPIQEHYRYPKEWYIEQLKQAMKGE